MILNTIIIEATWITPDKQIDVAQHKAQVKYSPVNMRNRIATATTEDVITRNGRNTNQATVMWCETIRAFVVECWL